MALQFILGSSRSGKTDFIYEQMIKDSMEHEDEGVFSSLYLTSQHSMHKDSLYKDIHAMEHLILMWWDF